MKLKRLARGFGAYTAANLIHKGAIFLAVPVFTRLLGPADYGRWTLVLSTYAISVLLFDAGVSKAVPRFYVERRSSDLDAFISSALCMRLLVSLLAAGLCWLFSAEVVAVVAGEHVQYGRLAAPVVVLCFSESLISFNLALLRARELAAPYFWTRLCGTALQLIVGTSLVPANADPLIGLAWGYAFGSVAALLLSIYFVVRVHGAWPTLDQPSKSLPLLAFGVPVLFHDLGSWLRSSSDPFLLARFANMSDVSIYSLATMSGLAIALVAFSFDLAYSPFFYRMLQDGSDVGRRRAVHVARSYLALMGMIASVPILFAPEIYSLIVPLQYSGAAIYAPLICLGYLLFVIYTIEVKPLFFCKKTALVPVITLVPSALGVGANYVLLPHTGAHGLPWVWAGCFALMAIGATIFSRRFDSIRFGAAFPVLLVVVLLGVVLLIPAIRQLPYSVSAMVRGGFFVVICACLAKLMLKEIREIRLE